ncbi:hypothetical protein DM02DRAFT_528227 [Periconia macrospinosa]|uniref:Major facilitator superfamily (MFS) profile domain-containing protein n=1 Tax=Periconia macrospinosa TaxID=97972 RepID=A0A2V1DPL4_9PLEO|nr:hypothetical protein DM02DRAFT_528227 [Periconia macrospinosa]
MGRKGCLTVAIPIFTIFSGGCGAAQTSIQLYASPFNLDIPVALIVHEIIMLRAFQGLGGSGITAIVLSIIVEMVPPHRYATYASITAISFAFSYLLGLFIGAVINDRTTWRWIFLIKYLITQRSTVLGASSLIFSPI